jgi:glucokinase
MDFLANRSLPILVTIHANLGLEGAQMYLGIEIGGTKLQLGLGRGDGQLAALWRGHVDRAAGAAGIRRQIVLALPELLLQAGIGRDQVRAAGIGFGGPVDDATGRVITSHQVEGWDGFPLATWLSQLLEVPALLGNDADVAGLGEAHFGAGKGCSPLFYITLGSGIGGGLIVDGKIYQGAGKGAAEIGHLRLPFLRRDGVLQYLALEQIASGWAIAEWARKEMRRSQQHAEMWSGVQGPDPELTARHVAAAAAQGDGTASAAAWGILSVAWESLAEAICHVIALTAPRRIVIGGGVALMGEQLLFEPLRRLVAERVFRPFADSYDIVPAALGEEMVVHGAVALASFPRSAWERTSGRSAARPGNVTIPTPPTCGE